MADERHDVAFVVGALLGGLAGATVTLFNAPQAGAQTRAQLAEQVGALSGKVGTATARLGEQGERLGRQAGAAISTLTERGGRDAGADGGTDRAATEATTEPSTEPVMLLPDPLEPDPVVVDDVAAATAGGNVTVGGLTAGDDLDLVIDGPRPAATDR